MIKPGDIMWHRAHDRHVDPQHDIPYLIVELIDNGRERPADKWGYWSPPSIRFLCLENGELLTLDGEQVRGLVKDNLVYFT